MINVEKNFGKTVSPKLGNSLFNFSAATYSTFKCPSMLMKKRTNPSSYGGDSSSNKKSHYKENLNSSNFSDKSDDSTKNSHKKKSKLDNDDDFLNISSRMESFCINSNSKYNNENANRYKPKFGGLSTKLFGDRKPLMKQQQSQNQTQQLSDFDCILKKTRDENNLIKKAQRVNKFN